MLHTLAVENYRSIRRLVLDLDRLNIVSGANGSGKSSLYRALRLLARTATGEVGAAFAEEGGIPSALWGGPENISKRMRSGEVAVQGTVRSGPVRIKLGFCDDEFGYQISFGLPVPSRSLFHRDPEIKHEAIWVGHTPRPSTILMERKGPVIRVRGEKSLEVLTDQATIHESVLVQALDPVRSPEVVALRQRISRWRFYDSLRTDATAPVRSAHLATRTPVLHHDGRDLASAIETIREVGDGERLDDIIARSLSGSVLEPQLFDDGRLALRVRQPGMLRPLEMHELSDGTVRFILLAAALLTPRPPAVMVLNEPEGSLHGELLSPLAELIIEAAKRMQVWVVTHSPGLLTSLSATKSVRPITLTKEFGQTTVAEQERDTIPRWDWID